MDGSRFDALTRRAFGTALGGIAASLLALRSAPEVAVGKHKKHKHKSHGCLQIQAHCANDADCCDGRSCAGGSWPKPRKQCCSWDTCSENYDCCSGRTCQSGTCFS